jgi:hypothetical protein
VKFSRFTGSFCRNVIEDGQDAVMLFWAVIIVSIF